ncbi:MAG: threonine synthase [Promethearchaeota archaeon]
MKYIMKCMVCDNVMMDDEGIFFVCPYCGSPLNLNIIHDKVGKIKLDFFEGKTDSMWKFFPFLPLKSEINIVSLGEGATPLTRSQNLANTIDIPNLYMKNETMNPTGSFIDTQISLGVSIAKEFGYTKGISLSTGNVGASIAAYSARAGIKSLVLVPNNYRKGKLKQISLYGGNAIQVDSSSYQILMDLVTMTAKKHDAINLATTSLYNAFTNHGAKTIIYEIFEQLDFSLPDLIVVPVGGAGLISALIQACLELKELSFIKKVPFFIAVQPEGCHPFIDALERDLDPETVYKTPWGKVSTRISALANDIPFDYTWFYWLKQQGRLKNIKGVLVSDKEAVNAQECISKHEGIFVELASATTYAALKKLLKDESFPIEKFETCVMILTGTGLLDIENSFGNIASPQKYELSSCMDAVNSFFS